MRPISLISGHTWHGRKGAVENSFRYAVDYLRICPEHIGSHPRLFGIDCAAPVSFHNQDHGGVPKKGRGTAWVRELLRERELPDAARIELITQPRVFGYVFNPVSFWLCFDPSENLYLVVAEVTNTYGDRHSYLCHNDDFSSIQADQILTAQKVFYVSPFQDIGGDYRFRFDIRDDRIGIWIDHSNGDIGVTATLTGRTKPVTTVALLGMCLRRPLGSWRVMGLIHWQAFKLWRKGVSFRQRPKPPATEVSR